MVIKTKYYLFFSLFSPNQISKVVYNFFIYYFIFLYSILFTKHRRKNNSFIPVFSNISTKYNI